MLNKEFKYNAVIILILLVNIILLIKIIIIYKNERNLFLEKNKLWNIFYENNNKNSLLNPENYRYKKIKFKLFNDGNFKLVTVFQPKGCPKCIFNEVKYLNEFYKKFPLYLYVFQIKGDKTFLKNFGAKFKINIINSIFDLFNKKLYFEPPLSFLIGPDNSIYFMHKTEIGMIIKSKLFYNRMIKLFYFIKRKK